jgi:hypothetical protein
MPVFHDSALIGAAGAAVGGGGYAIERSLRLNAPDSAYLSRTPASAGNRRTWTWAGWVKRSGLGTEQSLLSCGTSANNSTFGQIIFGSDNTFRVNAYSTTWRGTSAVFRDTSAWYHFVVAFDTTQATAANRVKIYINGIEVTAFGLYSDPTQNTDYAINQAVQHTIGRHDLGGGGNYFDGCLADCFLIDGQALDPTSFGEFSATTGVWMPKAFSGGSYGTNGWQLKFEDNSSNTATTLGKDTSGNGNNWTPNNLSVTAGAGNDSLVDVPTNGSEVDTGVGGEVRGNYAVLNPLNYTGTVTLSNGNLDATGSNANASSTIAPSSGKWYAEFSFSAIGAAVGFVGISNKLSADAFSGATQTWQLNYTNTGKLENAGSQSNVSTFTTGDIIGVAFDCSNGQATFYKNGSSVGTITGSAFVGVPVLVGAGAGGAAGTNTFTANYGARSFAYTAPSGFKALCTANLPAPVVTKPSDAFDVTLYTGNSTDNRAITGLGFSPDLVWFGPRSQSGQDKVICDSVRGVQKALFSNQTYVEADPALYGSVGSFDANGFTIKKGTDATFGFHQVNLNSSTYAAWCWDAGSSTVTNNTGTITGAQVRANASAGTSVVAYTGNGTSGATVGHGLGAAPGLIIVKKRSAADDWVVYHSALGATKYLWLHATNAEQTGTSRWNDTAPTSTVFSLGNNSSVNGNASTFIAYCFAPVAGYSSFGSYSANGSSDGPMIFTNFRPRFVMVKQTNASGQGWFMLDSSRSPYNVSTTYLLAQSGNAEASGYVDMDFLSNGFKIRSADGAVNASGGTYVYCAFAESPFQYARAR